MLSICRCFTYVYIASADAEHMDMQNLSTVLSFSAEIRKKGEPDLLPATGRFLLSTPHVVSHPATSDTTYGVCQEKGHLKTPLPPAPPPCYPSGYCSNRKKSDPATTGVRQLRGGNISRLTDTCMTLSRVMFYRVILRNLSVTLSDSQHGDDAVGEITEH